jgi:hypothetical protein
MEHRQNPRTAKALDQILAKIDRLIALCRGFTVYNERYALAASEASQAAERAIRPPQATKRAGHTEGYDQN